MSGTQQEQVTRQEFHVLSENVNDMKQLMSKMVDAISRISVLDEHKQTMTAFMQKLDDRMGRMETRQHDADISRAVAQASATQMSTMQLDVANLKEQRATDKARVEAIVWTIRVLWAISAAVLGGVGYLIKILPAS